MSTYTHLFTPLHRLEVPTQKYYQERTDLFKTLADRYAEPKDEAEIGLKTLFNHAADISRKACEVHATYTTQLSQYNQLPWLKQWITRKPKFTDTWSWSDIKVHRAFEAASLWNLDVNLGLLENGSPAFLSAFQRSESVNIEKLNALISPELQLSVLKEAKPIAKAKLKYIGLKQFIADHERQDVIVLADNYGRRRNKVDLAEIITGQKAFPIIDVHSVPGYYPAM